MFSVWWREGDSQPPSSLSSLEALAARIQAVRKLHLGHAGIKAIKLYAWEQPYIDRINQLREAELKMIRKAAFYQIFNTIMFGGGPILVSLASFGAFTFQGYSLTASVAFPALALFNLLRFPVMMFPNQIMNIIAAKVALDRIQNYMQVTSACFLWVLDTPIAADKVWGRGVGEGGEGGNICWTRRQCTDEIGKGWKCLVLSKQAVVEKFKLWFAHVVHCLPIWCIAKPLD